MTKHVKLDTKKLVGLRLRDSGAKVGNGNGKHCQPREA